MKAASTRRGRQLRVSCEDKDDDEDKDDEEDKDDDEDEDEQCSPSTGAGRARALVRSDRLAHHAPHRILIIAARSLARRIAQIAYDHIVLRMIMTTQPVNGYATLSGPDALGPLPVHRQDAYGGAGLPGSGGRIGRMSGLPRPPTSGRGRPFGPLHREAPVSPLSM